MSREPVFTTRRTLLLGLGVGVVGVAAAAAPVLSLRLKNARSPARMSWWDRTFVSLQNAGYAEWTTVVGEMFTLETASGPRTLKVTAVKAFPQVGRRPASLGRSQAFSVVFRTLGGSDPATGDVTYQLTHPTYPPLPIYMSAVIKTGPRAELLAIFN